MASLVGQIRKEPLFRKVNSRTHGVRHGMCGDFRHDRNAKKDVKSDETRGTMHGTKYHGLDYTPLFKFLLSRVGRQWDEVYSEAIARLDKKEPIFWMVALHESDRKNYFCSGENSFFSGL